MKTNDYGMLFEDIIKNIFGVPKTPIYFSGYYDTNPYVFKSMLLTICIYEINYNDDKYTEEELEIIKDYERKASKNENSNSDDINFLEFLKTSKEL